VIRGRNIVCLASNWRDHPTSKHHVMRQLAQYNHVLWVNFHASRRPQLTRRDAHLALRRLWQTWAGTRRVGPHLDLLSPLLVPLPASRLARWINSRVVCRQIRSALDHLPVRPVQLWLFAPDIPEVIGQLPAERVVYYCVDDFAAFSGYDAALVERLERRTVAGSDLVITTSAELQMRHRRQHRCVHLVPHGVDFDHFATACTLPEHAIPDDLKPIRRPIFGYMGVTADYVDLPLLAQAARARPDWSWVLLGDVRCAMSAVAGLKNIHILGGRPYEQLPAYCRGFDVGLIPFRMNRLTRAVNPIKLREYLAAGLPVVSAPLEAVKAYAPAVQIAETLPEFLAACERALHMAVDGRPQARQDLVRAESWRFRVEYLSHLVETLAETRAVPPAVQRHAHPDAPAAHPCSVRTMVEAGS
jgi:glycosyltransferase involved in cell wall biosynthesis